MQMCRQPSSMSVIKPNALGFLQSVKNHKIFERDMVFDLNSPPDSFPYNVSNLKSFGILKCITPAVSLCGGIAPTQKCEAVGTRMGWTPVDSVLTWGIDSPTHWHALSTMSVALRRLNWLLMNGLLGIITITTWLQRRGHSDVWDDHKLSDCVKTSDEDVRQHQSTMLVEYQ